MRRLTVLLGLLVALASAPTADAATVLSPLHSVSGVSARIVDATGREVLLRGVDEDALGQYYQQYPQLPPVLRLTENDFREMAGLGFNVVRLIVNWSALEPTRGAFDLGYVRRIRQAVGWAAANGIYVVLDMHQDAWGISVRGTPGQTCPSGSTPPVGFDGAPAWATITDGAPACAVDDVREISPADETAWQNFYDNVGSIRAELIDTWARLAGQFARDPAIAGYDLLNEPNPGLNFNEALNGLEDYYAGALDAIRAAERAAHGFPHIAFFEPGVEWSAAGTTVTPKWSFTSEPNVVFAPHLYGGSIAVASVDQGYKYAASGASEYGTTIWSGEYGWYGDPAADQANIAEFARDQDAYIWGGAWWQWKQACGSPSTIGDYGGKPPKITNSLVRINCVTGAAAGPGLPSVSAMAIPASTERILARATVRAAPGVITSLHSDPASGAFSVSGSDAAGSRGSCRLSVWVPGPGRPRFAGARAGAVRVRGGYEVSACVRGSWTFRLVGRDRPALPCQRALSLRARGGILRLRESTRAESVCRGTLRVRRTLSFSLRPGGSITYRLPGRPRRLVAVLSGVDIDGNAFRRRVSLD